MKEHPEGEELILCYYGELPAADAAALRDHRAACPSCQAAWDELVAALSAVAAAVPGEPGADFESRMWARIQPALPNRRPAWTSRQLVPLAAWAALVLVIVGVQALNAPAPAVDVRVRDAAAPETQLDAHRRVLFTALDGHLAQTEMLLVEMKNAPEGPTPGFGFERHTAADLLASGRLYRETASQTGDLHLVAVLDDLESVLIEVARAPDAPRPEDVDLIRERIDAVDLLFKVRAVTTEIRGNQPQREAESE